MCSGRIRRIAELICHFSRGVCCAGGAAGGGPDICGQLLHQRDGAAANDSAQGVPGDFPAALGRMGAICGAASLTGDCFICPSTAC